MKARKHVIALMISIFAISLCVWCLPAWAESLASSDGSPSCSHVHDDSCGYVEGVEGSCTHQHDASCGYAADSADAGASDSACSVTSWEWVDDQGMLNESDGAWGMGLAGASESAPVTRDTLENLLPSQITATTDAGEQKTLDITWDLSSIPEEGASEGSYQVSASLSDAAYSLADGASPLAVTVQVGGAESYNLTMPSGTPPYPDHIVNGVSPNGTSIDLFDYWLTSQDASDNTEPSDMQNLGINAGHTLKFIKQGKGGWENINSWTNGKNPRTGLVLDKLVNGYPMLANGNDESLNYLFDPSVSHNGKASYTDVKGLLQVDDDGYYYYNSQKNFATFYQDSNSFTLYDEPGVIPAGTSPVGQFFPFNAANADAKTATHKGNSYTVMNDDKSDSVNINHWFGIHMSTRFIQQFGGYTADKDKGGKPVTYEFSGDDDVWIYIDGKLVGDLGGIHDAASIKIDFSTGKITINDKEQSQTLGKLLGLSSDVLPDNTYHTLDFFYLERGNYDSNMSLKYNLVTIPESGVIKVDQVGNPVYGAEFTLYSAKDYEQNKTAAQAIAVGTTDTAGKFTFIKKENGEERPITIGELYTSYGDSRDKEGNNLVLVETKTPAGYRTCGELGLYFYTHGKEVMLLSGENTIWEKGAYAMPKVVATTGNKIKIMDDPTDVTGSGSTGSTIDLVGEHSVEDPVMFAVVFKKGADGSWYPVSGDPVHGWTVHKSNDWNTILSVAQTENYTFQLSRSGSYQVEVDNLPGNIQTYYHICQDESTAQYTIAYYYTEASSLAGATADNTHRIDPDISVDEGGLNRAFSMSLYVTNMKNRLIVQKVDDEGKTVDGAQFSLYKASEVTVSDDGEVTPNEGASPAVVTTGTVEKPIKLTGGAVFPDNAGTGAVLENGEYWLLETKAPVGYKKKTKPVHVIVDNTGVYADAGEADDGVTVLRGLGSVARSMVQFAADDGVDITLRDVKVALATSVDYSGSYNENGSFTYSDSGIDWNSTADDVLHLRYKNANAMLDYGLQGSGGSPTLDQLTLATDEGWSKLLARQCYQHDEKVDTTLKTDLGDRDITNLFSGTVTVRVANDKTGNLKISKQVTGDGAPQGEAFTFEVKLAKDGTPVTGTYETKDADGKKSTVTFKDDGTTTISVESGKSLTILALPTGVSYTVTEKNIPNRFTPSVVVNGDDTSSINGNKTASGTIQHNTTEDSAVEVAYTNTFDGSTTLKLQGEKTLRGKNMTSGDSFTFELTAAPGDTATSNAISAGKIVMPDNTRATIKGTGDSESAGFTFDDIRFNTEGTFTFNITEQLPANVSGDNPYDDDTWYDIHTTVVSVKVTRDASTGVLNAAPTYDNSNNPDHSSGQDKAEFVNRFASLRVSKTVKGDMGDRDKDFDFTITAKESDGITVLEGSYPCKINGQAASLEFENGEATFQLKHGQDIVIYGMPVGTTCTVAETGAKDDGYTVKVAVDNGEQQTGDHVDGVEVDGEGTTEVAFENARGDIPATGIHIDFRPWLIAAAIAVVAGIALANRSRRSARRSFRGGNHFDA